MASKRVAAKTLGNSFEDVVEAALDTPNGCFARGHPASKVIKGRVIHTAKNGVDFVGVWKGRAMAIEAKRLPKATSLRGSKDDSTQAEAAFLLRYLDALGSGAFLVYDPEQALIHVVWAREHLTTIAAGGFVPLRKGEGSVWSFTATPSTIIVAVRAIMETL